MADAIEHTRQHPLSSQKPIRHAALALVPLPGATRLALRIAQRDQSGIGTVAGLDLAKPINTWVSRDASTRALRLGPDEWLVIADDGLASPLVSALGDGLGDRFGAIVDVSHRYAAVEISGPAAADVLNSSCLLDLDAKAFPTGTATRTLLAKAEIVLARLDDKPTYRIEMARSFAAYVWNLLAEASREVTGA